MDQHHDRLHAEDARTFAALGADFATTTTATTGAPRGGGAMARNPAVDESTSASFFVAYAVLALMAATLLFGWLANHLNARGLSLQRGMIVATGQTCIHRGVMAGDRVVASFGTLGQVDMVVDP